MKTPFLLHANNLTSSELIGIAPKTEINPVFAGQNSSRRTRATHYSGPTSNAEHSANAFVGSWKFRVEGSTFHRAECAEFWLPWPAKFRDAHPNARWKM